jgi:hypothetical protein
VIAFGFLGQDIHIALQNSALLPPLLLERAGVYPQGIKGDIKSRILMSKKYISHYGHSRAANNLTNQNNPALLKRISWI